jgi:hypothetical protein
MAAVTNLEPYFVSVIMYLLAKSYNEKYPVGYAEQNFG